MIFKNHFINMECKTIVYIITTVLLSVLFLVFFILWLVEMNNCKSHSKKITNQELMIKSLNNKILSLNDKPKYYKIEKSLQDKQKENELKNNLTQDKIFIFGVTDNLNIVCESNQVATVKSLYTKVVDDYNSTDTEIINLTRYVPAFANLNNKQVISMSSKSIIDNLKISIPYALPNDEIVKTRILYGTYVCQSN